MAVIEYTKEGKIAIFTINRPEKMNVLNLEAMRQFTDLLKEFRDDDDLWVGILTGTGEKVFSAGVDIKDFLPMIRRTPDRKWQRPTAIMRGMELWKPMIAACNGLTIGGGLEMALACDIMIAAENGEFRPSRGEGSASVREAAAQRGCPAPSRADWPLRCSLPARP